MKKQPLIVHCWHRILVVLLCGFGVTVCSIPATAGGEQTGLRHWSAITPQTIAGDWIGLKSSKMVVRLTVADVIASTDSSSGQRFEVTAESTTYSLTEWTQHKGNPPEPMAYGQRVPPTKYKGYIEPASRVMVLTKETAMEKRRDGFLHEVEPEIIYGVLAADNNEIAGQVKTSARARFSFVVTRAKNAKSLIAFYTGTPAKAGGKVPKDEAIIAWTEDLVQSGRAADFLRNQFSPGSLNPRDVVFWATLMDDARFVKVFGCKFDEMPPRRTAAISQRLRVMQRTGKTGLLSLAAVAENVFPGYANEAQIEARAGRNLRAWKDAVVAELKSDEVLPDTGERIASFERAADTPVLDSLHEAERPDLFALTHDATMRKSGDALNQALAKLEAIAPSRPLLDELLFWEVSNNGLLHGKSKADWSAYRERLLRKIDDTIESLLVEYDRRLAAVPSASLTGEIGWYADLVADFGTAFTRPPIRKRLDALAERRNQSVAAVADGMLKQIRTARTTNQVDSILTTSFRIPGDSVLPAAIPVFDAAHVRKVELAGTRKQAGQTLGPDDNSILASPKVGFDNEVVDRLFHGEFAMLKEDIAEGEYARAENDLLGRLGFVPDYEFAVLAFCKYSAERCGTRTVGPAVKLKYTQVTTTTLGPWGPEINREERDLGEITLPSAMSAPYDGVSRRAGILMMLSRGSMVVPAKQVLDDIRGFYDVWKPQSAGIAQLQDNLSRYWNKQPSLQEEFDVGRPWPLRLERAVRRHAGRTTFGSQDAAISDPIGVLTVFGNDLSVRDRSTLCENYTTANLIIAALKLGRLDDLIRCLKARGHDLDSHPQVPGANDVVSLHRTLSPDWFFGEIAFGAVRGRLTRVFDTYDDVGTKVKSRNLWNAFQATVVRGGTFEDIQREYAERFKKIVREGYSPAVGTYNLEMAWKNHASGILERPLTRGDLYLLWLMLADPREGQGAYDSPQFAQWLAQESAGATAQMIREATYNRLYLTRKGKTPSPMNEQIVSFVLANKIPRTK